MPPQNSSTDIAPKDQSQRQFLKECGYDGMQHFMLSYGLKMWNDDDLEEAKAILEGLRETWQAEWERNHGK